jgi:hypothetical protein
VNISRGVFESLSAGAGHAFPGSPAWCRVPDADVCRKLDRELASSVTTGRSSVLFFRVILVLDAAAAGDRLTTHKLGNPAAGCMKTGRSFAKGFVKPAERPRRSAVMRVLQG